MPTKKRFSSRFPPARIKKIMQTDEEIGKVASPVPVLVSRAVELFLQSFLTQTSEVVRAKNSKTLSCSHIKHTVMQEKTFDFLHDLVKPIEDLPEYDAADDAQSPMASASKGKRKGKGRGKRGRPRKTEKATKKRRSSGEQSNEQDGDDNGENGEELSSDEDDEACEEDQALDLSVKPSRDSSRNRESTDEKSSPETRKTTQDSARQTHGRRDFMLPVVVNVDDDNDCQLYGKELDTPSGNISVATLPVPIATPMASPSLAFPMATEPILQPVAQVIDDDDDYDS